MNLTKGHHFTCSIFMTSDNVQHGKAPRASNSQDWVCWAAFTGRKSAVVNIIILCDKRNTYLFGHTWRISLCRPREEEVRAEGIRAPWRGKLRSWIYQLSVYPNQVWTQSPWDPEDEPLFPTGMGAGIYLCQRAVPCGTAAQGAVSSAPDWRWHVEERGGETPQSHNPH